MRRAIERHLSMPVGYSSPYISTDYADYQDPFSVDDLDPSRAAKRRERELEKEALRAEEARLSGRPPKRDEPRPPAHKTSKFFNDGVRNAAVSHWLIKRDQPPPVRLTKEERAKFTGMFAALDVDHSGSIDANEVYKAFQVLGYSVPRTQVEQMIKDVDPDATGTLNEEEFVFLMTQADLSGTTTLVSSFPILARTYQMRQLVDGVILSSNLPSATKAALMAEERPEQLKTLMVRQKSSLAFVAVGTESKKNSQQQARRLSMAVAGTRAFGGFGKPASTFLTQRPATAGATPAGGGSDKLCSGALSSRAGAAERTKSERRTGKWSGERPTTAPA
jgi:hypothetical protein